VAKVRVPIYNTPGKSTTVDPGATVGAIVGRNLFLQDGTVVTKEMIFAPAPPTEPELGFTYWKLVREVPTNVVALAKATGTGLFAVTDEGTGAFRSILGTAGEIDVANGDAVAGPPTLSLADVTPASGGTLQRTTFDTKGRRSEEADATTSHLPEGSNLYYTDTRADARIDVQKGQPLGLATLDANSKLDAGQLPALAITETFVVNTEAAMLALVAQQGDVAVRSDEQKSYILTADPASTLANWQELLVPTGVGVASFNGRTGSVVPATGDYTPAQVGAAPASHVGSGGSEHAAATSLAAGFMVSADKIKLDALLPSPRQIEGLQISASGTTIAVGPGTAYVESEAESVAFAGGTIATAPASATTYHVYLTSAGAIERSTTAPASPYSGTARSKSGDTSRRYLGSVRSLPAAATYYPQSSDAAYSQVQVTFLHNVSVESRIINSGISTTPADVSAAAFCPATANSLRLRITNTGASGFVRYYIWSGAAFGIYSNVPTAGIVITDVPCDGTPKIQYDVTGSGVAFLDLLGYSYAR
jgi:hypothetical protein